MINYRQQNQKFEALIRQYQGLALTVAYSVLLDAQESLDLVQNAFVKALHEPRFIEEDFNHKNWLLKVVRNDALNLRKSWWRKLKLLADFRECDRPDASPGLCELFAREQSIVRLKEALQSLSDDEREIVALRFAAGCPYEQIAEQLGIKIGTVMSRLARVKEKIAGIMGDDYCD